MAAQPPEDPTLLAQIGIGATTVMGWFWAMITRNNKKLDEIKADLADHEKHVAEHYPTRAQMKEALDDTVVPIHKKLDRISDQLDKERDNEVQRLREELAKHSRRD